MADVVDLTGEPDVVDLTDEPKAKRQDLSNAPPKLGDDLLDLVYKQLPLREKMRAARVNKGFNRVAKHNMLGEAEGKLKHIVHYYQKRIARPHVSSEGIDQEMSWARGGKPYPIREVIKEIRRQERVGGGGSDLREETREAINYGGDTGYVITQTRKPIDIGRS
eukprot:SAG22_NODE_1029_length_5939_cov_46.559589_2_plen_164_part_00